MKTYLVIYTNGTHEKIDADSFFDDELLLSIKRSCEFSETAVRQVILLGN